MLKKIGGGGGAEAPDEELPKGWTRIDPPNNIISGIVQYRDDDDNYFHKGKRYTKEQFRDLTSKEPPLFWNDIQKRTVETVGEEKIPFDNWVKTEVIDTPYFSIPHGRSYSQRDFMRMMLEQAAEEKEAAEVVKD